MKIYITAIYLIAMIIGNMNCHASEIQQLPSSPVIDGIRDEAFANLQLSVFDTQYTFNNQYDELSKDYSVEYLIAYATDGLYILFETNASEVDYHKRGFLYGDGFKVILGKPSPSGISNEYIEIAYSPTILEEDHWARQYISSYNFNGPRKRLSNKSQMQEAVSEGGSSFEVLIAWQDIYPYHPGFYDQLGVNLYFAKGMRNLKQEHVTKGFAILADEGFWEESQPYRHLKPFTYLSRQQQLAKPDSFHFKYRTIIEGQQLKIEFNNDITNTQSAQWEILDENNERLLSKQLQRINADKPIYLISTESLPAGNYSLVVSRASHTQTQTFSILPSNNFREQLISLYKEGELELSSITTLEYRVNEIENELLNLKYYEDAPGLLAKMESIQSLITQMQAGKDIFQSPGSHMRRAFRSQLDGTLQPYSIKLPTSYNKDTKYPLLVFLHGSGIDDQGLLNQERGNGDYIVIAPKGRDKFNAYAYKKSEIDINEAINDVIENYPIDESNIVIGGFSMGGYGALLTYTKNPQRYSGVAVFAGHPNLANQWLGTTIYPDFRDLKTLKGFKDVPIFLYHGTDDPALPFSLIKTMKTDLESIGAIVDYSFIEKRGHVYQDPKTHQQFGEWLRILDKEND